MSPNDRKDDERTLGDEAFDEYLQRDSNVSQHYRHLDAGDVPPALDSAVLAQAQQALTQKANRRPAWTRWTAPLALAASVVLGVAIVLQIGVEEKVAMPVPQTELMTTRDTAADAFAAEAVEQKHEQQAMKSNTDAPSPAPQADAPPAASPPAAASDRMFKRSEPERADERGRASSPDTQAPAESDARLLPAMPVAASAQAPSAPEAKEKSVAAAANRAAAMIREEEARRSAQFASNSGFSQASGQLAPAPTAVRQTTAPSPVINAPQAIQIPRLAPQEWLEQIRELRREGKVTEADEQWRQFVEAYPDFKVATDDLARPKP
jgi:hypothetical protein